MDARVARSTGGAVPMAIGGRMVRERERLLGMTTEERAWRAQFLKDQHLTDREPVHVPEYWRQRMNPIRRFYRAPLDAFETAIKPIVGPGYSPHLRFWAGKIILGAIFFYAGAYYMKYNSNDWTRKSGWRYITSKKVCNPGDPGYPKASDRSQPSDYASKGFNKQNVL